MGCGRRQSLVDAEEQNECREASVVFGFGFVHLFLLWKEHLIGINSLHRCLSAQCTIVNYRHSAIGAYL